MSYYKFSGTTAAELYSWLNANKNGTFLEDCTISNDTASKTLTISKNGVSFSNFYNVNGETNTYGNIRYDNGTINKTLSNDMASRVSVICREAILNKNGLIMSFYVSNTSTLFIGVVMLTIDNNNDLCAIFRNCEGFTSANANATNISLITKNSTAITTLNVTPTYGTQRTGLIPAVINTPVGDTTIPPFYTSIQSQLPSIGIQAGRMDSTDYITNGYCFIRD